VKPKLPVVCPSCQSCLEVTSLQCCQCNTEVKGHYPLSVLSRLSEEEQAFVIAFVKYSGSLKEIAKWKGLSYPTVRNRLDELIVNIETLEKESL